jgi:hypothetical protein
MHVSSFVISFGLAVVAQQLAREKGPFWSKGMFITALLAAFLAPVARDLVAAIEKLRA